VDATERKTNTHTQSEKKREGRTSRVTAAATMGRHTLQMLRLETPVGVTP